MKEIHAEDFSKLKNPVIIDVRSPIEFKDGAIPGAINVPLFTNEERVVIGTVYKQEGQAAAKWRAMEFVSPKIPDMLHRIKDLASSGDELIINCWRGGMRSNAVVTFLEFSGIYSWRFVGGYRAYRQYILSQLPTMFPEKAVVFHGLTGVGKTVILKRLMSNGYPVLDLEEMAGHRGSIFGTIGLGDGHNQKTFDSLLFKGLKEIQGSSYFLIEAESKRIGKAVQPEELMEKKRQGINFYIHSPIEQRIKLLIDEYVTPYKDEPWYDEKIQESLEKVLRRVKNADIKNELIEALKNRKYPELIELLLEHYYDPRYDHKRYEYEGDFIDIPAENPDEAAEMIISHLDALTLKEKKEMPLF
ncbi:tRNA 2-selenouridine(34) synthase MnmH [Bacillus sp. MUM 116]|uniref:tRNA 2-selenouridine(34) synthase MnmH n=1 Tax=Bacillus sp. MUM 116 TaxID=1678002 RepID=UPI0008F56ADD|nr:tRNA 2-selenouridine(34) synthase MnmH [Bacillus sp. MUM 116]OIK11540.1 tRNA 2-selenouridine(34) synthase MnmH [Bacillus sp. MUM 116]